MTFNRNFVFLESFSALMVGIIILNIWEFVATLASNDPQNYIFTLAGYVIVILILGFFIYKITYKPPKTEKIVNNAQQKQTKLLDGLKTKMEKIDDKRAKKLRNKQQKAESKNQQTLDTGLKVNTTPITSNKTVSPSSSSSKTKPKQVRRRR